MTRVHTRYSDVFADVRGDMAQRAGAIKTLSTLKINVKECKKVSVEAFDKNCDSGLYTLSYHVLDHIAEDVQRFGMLSVLDRSQ